MEFEEKDFQELLHKWYLYRSINNELYSNFFELIDYEYQHDTGDCFKIGSLLGTDKIIEIKSLASSAQDIERRISKIFEEYLADF